MTTFEQLQEEVGIWAYKNFGVQPSHWCLKGALEEFGELCTSDLKTDQGLADTPKYKKRGTVGEEAEKDAIGDIVIYLMDYCYRTEQQVDFAHIPPEIRWGDTTKDQALAMVGNGLAHAYKAAVNDGMPWVIEAGLAAAVRGLKLYCRAKDYDFNECVFDAAEEVLGRDWNKERAKA